MIVSYCTYLDLTFSTPRFLLLSINMPINIGRKLEICSLSRQNTLHLESCLPQWDKRLLLHHFPFLLHNGNPDVVRPDISR